MNQLFWRNFNLLIILWTLTPGKVYIFLLSGCIPYLLCKFSSSLCTSSLLFFKNFYKTTINSAAVYFQIQDLTILEEVLRMVLEIINSCLTHQLPHNPNLVYTLLYKKDIFQPFRVHSAFQDIVQNIDSVINFFSYKLEQTDQSQIGVSEVLSTIQQGTSQWPKDRLRVLHFNTF